MLDWFKKLMPKEEKFFDLFEAHAAKAQEAARSLRAAVALAGFVVAQSRAAATANCDPPHRPNCLAPKSPAPGSDRPARYLRRIRVQLARRLVQPIVAFPHLLDAECAGLEMLAHCLVRPNRLTLDRKDPRRRAGRCVTTA